MRRLVGVEAARVGQACREHVERLNREDRIERRIVADLEREIAIGDARWRGQDDARATLAQVARQLDEPGLLGAAQREDDERIAMLDERHRAVAELGAAERLGLNGARLLELERR